MNPLGFDLAQLGDLPLAVAVLVVVLVSFYMITRQSNEREVRLEQIRSSERADIEKQRSAERAERDEHWRQFLRDERELDRQLGKSTASVYSNAIKSLGDAISEQNQTLRDQVASLSETTRTEVNRLSDGFLRNAASVESALQATRDDIRATISASAAAARDTNAMLFRVGEDLHAFGKLVSLRKGVSDPSEMLDHFASSGGLTPKDESQ